MVRAIFGIGALLAGFAKSKEWLYAARAVAGIGGGGINSLSMIIVSDVVPLRSRGTYLTLLGMGIAAGSGVYPLRKMYNRLSLSKQLTR
jgi:MFS family permease